MSMTRSVHTACTDSREAAAALLAGLEGVRARVLVFFAGIAHDGELLGRSLAGRFPGACVIGCSSNGEFSDHGHGKGGATVLALGEDRVGACACALAVADDDHEPGLVRACETIAARIGHPLRELDPTRHIGLALLEGARGREEAINATLGDLAPLLRFVGGSAGDDITFTGTWAWADGQFARNGTALLVAEMRTPFQVFKTCHFAPTERSVQVTRCDPSRRLIEELDGRPAAARYAELVGVPVEQLGFAEFLASPLGLMIDGEAWLRSPVRVEGEGLLLACAIAQGTRLNLMRATELIPDVQARMERVRGELAAAIDGAILFNCAYRMIEAQLTKQEEAYHAALSAMVHAGMQSNGESYLGHINQTLTGLVWA